MHHALQIVEVVRAICWVVKDSSLQGKCSLLHLAQTCRTFQDPALDALWEHIYTLDNLIYCLPKDAWTKNGVSELDCESYLSPTMMTTLNRPLTPADWAIIRKYAPRVRTLWQARPLSPETFWSLSLVPNGMMPLLPNLKDLRWVDKNLSDFPSMRLLLPSSLAIMNCSLSGDSRHVCSQIAALSRMCPGMKDLRMASYSRIPDAIEAFSRTLCSWSNIVCLHCEELTEDAWIHVSSLPRLKELSVAASPSTSFRKLRSRMPKNPFSSVTSLEFCSIELDQATEFITETGISPIDLEIYCLHNKSASPAEVLINAIAETCGGPLKKLIIGYANEEVFISPPSLGSIAQRGDLLTIASIRPLFKLRNLLMLKVDVVCKMDLNDQDVIELAKALPDLTTLSLNSRFGWQQRSKLTFFGLFSLLTICPNLEDIGIVFDAEDLSAFDSANVPAEQRPPIPRPRENYELTVGDSRVGNPKDVVVLLHDAFPNLEDIHSWLLHEALPMDDIRALEGMPHYLGWQKVQKLARKMLRNRRRLFSQWESVHLELRGHFGQDISDIKFVPYDWDSDEDSGSDDEIVMGV